MCRLSRLLLAAFLIRQSFFILLRPKDLTRFGQIILKCYARIAYKDSDGHNPATNPAGVEHREIAEEDQLRMPVTLGVASEVRGCDEHGQCEGEDGYALEHGECLQ